MGAKVFGFVEDPGSANFFVGLADALARKGCALELAATNPALSYLEARRQGARPWSGTADTASQTIDRSDLVLVGTSENRSSPAFALIEAAKRRAVPSVAIVDAPNSIAERFGEMGGAIRHRPEYVVCAQQEVCAAVTALDVATQAAHLIRHPYLDAIEHLQSRLVEERDKRRVSLYGGSASGRQVIVFLAEISSGLVSADFRRSPEYTLAGSGRSDRRTHIVLDEVLDALEPYRPGVHLVLRLHPKDAAAEYADYREKVDQVSRAEDPLAVVGCADAVIGMTTSLLTEAAVLGAPVISIVPRPMERDWLAQMTYPPIPVVWTREDLRAGLRELLAGAPVERRRVDLDRPTLADCLVAVLRERSEHA